MTPSSVTDLDVHKLANTMLKEGLSGHTIASHLGTIRQIQE